MTVQYAKESDLFNNFTTSHFSLGVRRAALLLHAMHVTDRQWILNHVDPQDQSRIRILLHEIKELGITPSIELIHSAIQQSVAEKKDRCTTALASDLNFMIDALNRLQGQGVSTDWQRLCAVLTHEPTSFVARFLDLHSWLWTEVILHQMSPARRERITRLRIQQTQAGKISEEEASELKAAILKLVHNHVFSVATRANEVVNKSSPNSAIESRWLDRLMRRFRFLLMNKNKYS